MLGFVDALGQGLSRLAMVAVSIERGRRDRIHCVRPNHLLHLKNVGIRWVLRAGAGPQYALRLSALGTQLVPLRAGKDVQISLIGQLAIRDRNFAQQTLDLLFFSSLGCFRTRAEFCIDQVVDAADEEAGDACDPPATSMPSCAASRA